MRGTTKNAIEHRPGIYRLQNLISGKFYVGSSVNLTQRYWQHRMRMKNLTHWNHRINADVEKFGRDSFLFGVVEYCEKENLLDREQYYIDNWIPDYNLRKDVDDCKSSWDKESRIKLGEKLKLAWVERKASLSPEEFKKKHGDARRGILHSDESKKNMSEKRKGKPKTDEWKEKMRQSRLGTKLIDGKYIKISEVY